MQQTFSITPEDFQQFSVFLEQSCGILLAEHKQYLVQSRLSKIMREQNCASLRELIQRLRAPGADWLKERVINAMTTNETLWFRDGHPYEILARQLLPEIDKMHRLQKLRIWSAACSSGQEPYSISMTIEEYKRTHPGAFGAGEEVLATDISTRVLEQARIGEYEMLALGRGLSRERLQKHFLQTGEGCWQVQPQIRARVRFQRLNLLGAYAMLGQFDIIFCRNVLIYFSPSAKQEILRKMHRQLRPGGYLLLGASESLSGLADCYRMIHCRPGIIYQAI